MGIDALMTNDQGVDLLDSSGKGTATKKDTQKTMMHLSCIRMLLCTVKHGGVSVELDG